MVTIAGGFILGVLGLVALLVVLALLEKSFFFVVDWFATISQQSKNQEPRK